MSEPAHRFEMVLAASAHHLWPLVTNTERLNVATGMPLVNYREEAQSAGLTRRFFSFQHMGLDFIGEELPSSWQQNHFFEINRHYSAGPFLELRLRVELRDVDPLNPDRGAHCSVNYWITPRGELGRQVLAGMADGMLATLRSVLSAAVAKLPSRGHNLNQQVIVVPGNEPSSDQLATAKRLGEIARTIYDSPVIEQIVSHLLYAADIDLRRIRPLEFARGQDLDADDCLNALLAACRAGLVIMLWKLVCPHCRSGPPGTAALADISSAGYCPSCDLDFEVELSSSLELVFQPHPQVREVIDAPYCMAGPASTPHLFLQQPLGPGETLTTELHLAPGVYRLRGEGARGASVFEVTSGDASIDELPRLDALRVEVVLQVSAGLGEANQRLTSVVGALPLRIHNDTQRPVIIRLEDSQWPSNSLLAADVISRQRFRELHTGQLLAPGISLGIGSVTILFTDIVGSTAMYEQIGDTDAFALVWNHFELLKNIITEHRGALVKTIGDAVMASFSRPMDAQRAALAMQEQINEAMTEAGHSHPVCLKMGIHTGPAIAITANNHLDYFGSTVNLAARTESRSIGGDIVISKAHVAATHNARVLVNAGWQSQELTATLKGFDDAVDLVRFSPAGPAS